MLAYEWSARVNGFCRATKFLRIQFLSNLTKEDNKRCFADASLLSPALFFAALRTVSAAIVPKKNVVGGCQHAVKQTVLRLELRKRELLLGREYQCFVSGRLILGSTT